MKNSKIIILLFALSSSIFAETIQTNLVFTLAELESIFLNQSLKIMAEKYQLKAEEAKILQAKLWINPEVEINQNIYNQETGKKFDTSKDGQSEIKILQKFPIYGRISKATELAENEYLGETEKFLNTLRFLKFDLRLNFYLLHYKRKILRFYDESITHLDHSLNIAEFNFKQGNITIIELVRIRDMVFQIEDERNKLRVEINDHHYRLKEFINNVNCEIETKIDEGNEDSVLNTKFSSIEDLTNRALDNRPDLKAMKIQIESSKLSLRLEQSKAWPDLLIGGHYDRQSNYIRDYKGIVIGLSIPIFDRNQGNIQVAKANLLSAEKKYEHKLLEVQSEIKARLDQFRDTTTLLKKYNEKLTRLETTLGPLLNKNYQKKYISSLEFSSSFESLRSTTTKYLLLQAQKYIHKEELILATGTEI